MHWGVTGRKRVRQRGHNKRSRDRGVSHRNGRRKPARRQIELQTWLLFWGLLNVPRSYSKEILADHRSDSNLTYRQTSLWAGVSRLEARKTHASRQGMGGPILGPLPYTTHAFNKATQLLERRDNPTASNQFVAPATPDLNLLNGERHRSV